MDKRQPLHIAIEAAIKAGVAILKVYQSEDLGIQSKKDESPLTQADLASNDIINSFLKDTGIPIISEENNQIDYGERAEWQDCWIVDPLDGTKEFIKRNGEFTVNIALVTQGSPKFGVIYVPVTRELYVGDVTSLKSYKMILDEDHNLTGELFTQDNRIYPMEKFGSTLKVVGSRSHMNDDTKKFIDTLSQNHGNKKVEVVSKGSSLKFCLVAEGKANIYPRFAPTMEWDTAAGQAICNAVGLKVTSMATDKALQYNKQNLLNSHFLVE